MTTPQMTNLQNSHQAGAISDFDICIDLLKATTELASVLLSNEDLDSSVDRALKILGTSIKADRVTLLQHHDYKTEETLGCLSTEYEWLASGIDSQKEHPELHHITYEGVEDCYNLFCAGKHWGGLIDTLPEPFRSGQLKLGVKATYGIPIMVQEKYWGLIGIDFCQTTRSLADEIIEVLKTAAACIGGAIDRDRIRQEQEKIRCDNLLQKQETRVLKERDRILKITTNTAQALLNDRDLKQAIAKALSIIGEGIDTDRVSIMKHHSDPLGISLGYSQMLYEWHSPHAVSQLEHPSLNRVSYEGIEDWYENLSQGKAMGGKVDKLPEPIRSGQLEIGVKFTYAVPIIINNQYWGIVAFDDCRSVKQRSETEISILKTTAACIGSAIEQNRIRQQQEEAERTILLEQQKATQLAQHNRVLQQRDRILKATAEASNVLLTEENFDRAVDQALQIIGESLDKDRVSVIENWHNPSKPLIPHWRLLYEWHSSETISQISHPQLTQGSYEGIEKWYELQSKGQSIRCRLAEIPEPFRSGQEKLGVKVLHAVPIFIEGKHWGIAGFDDCRKETHRSEAELSILKTAAACIGGAITKERSRCAKEEAEKTILLEREKAAIAKASQLAQSNRTLSLRDCWLEATANAANKLLEIADLDEGINAALKVLGSSLNCDRLNIMQYFESFGDRDREFVRVVYEWDTFDTISQISHPELNEISGAGIEDWFIKLKAGDWVGGMIDEFREPFRSTQEELGVKATYSVPIFVNNIHWGAICIDFCRQARRLTTPEIAVFKTAASCIGGAIYRQQIQQEKEQAELAILDERNRMAREIHDSLAQAFTGISLQLEAASHILSTQPEVAEERLLRAKNLAKEGISEARRSVRALRPEALEFNNLAIALHQLVDKMTSGTGINAQVIIEGELQSNPEIEVDLFRIAQEAITNTLRHAQATELTICLICQTDTVNLQVKDNGIGFEPQQLLDKSFGLIGIQERCDRHNGNLTINSSRDQGTEIGINIPI